MLQRAQTARGTPAIASQEHFRRLSTAFFASRGQPSQRPRGRLGGLERLGSCWNGAFCRPGPDEHGTLRLRIPSPPSGARLCVCHHVSTSDAATRPATLHAFQLDS